MKSRHGPKAGKRAHSLPKPASPFQPTTHDQVFGCLRYQGKPKTPLEMRESIAEEARRRYAKG
jgi:hypothetical protein